MARSAMPRISDGVIGEGYPVLLLILACGCPSESLLLLLASDMGSDALLLLAALTLDKERLCFSPGLGL